MSKDVNEREKKKKDTGRKEKKKEVAREGERRLPVNGERRAHETARVALDERRRSPYAVHFLRLVCTEERKKRGGKEGGRDRKGTPSGPEKRERHTIRKQRRKGG